MRRKQVVPCGNDARTGHAAFTRSRGARLGRSLSFVLPGYSVVALARSQELGTGRKLRGWLRVLLSAHNLDGYEGIRPFDPCIMTRRNCVRLARLDRFLGAVLEPHADLPGDRIADVRVLT